MSTAQLDYNPIGGFGFDISKDVKLLGRLKLPYKSFNFLALLTRRYGRDRYDNAKDLIELCQWMYVHVSDVRNIINRLAEYAVTDIQIDDTTTKVPKDNQESLLEILDKLNIKSKLVQIAKLYFATGNALTSVEVKFKKHLECPTCKTCYNISKIDFEFDSKNILYSAYCVECKTKKNMNIIDIKLRNADEIYVKIWDWHDIEFAYNPISDEYRYYYKIPIEIFNALNTKNPDKFYLETTPHYILKDVLTKKRGNNNNVLSEKRRLVAFPNKKIKHVKNDSTLNVVMGGWGEPLLVGVLQDVFFMQLLRQAQATLLADYIIPIRVVSPDPSAVSMMPLPDFAKKFDDLYTQFKRDPMQIMKAPFPIQYQTMSSEGKTLFLSNEMEYTRTCIRRGLGVPAELLDGGLQNFSGGSISLRMLENFLSNFLNTVLYGLANDFIIPAICLILNLPKFKVSFGKFKAMDDVQQKTAKLQLYQLNLISDTDIYEDYGVRRPTETELHESIERRATRDGKYQLNVGKYQAEMQADLMRANTRATIDSQEMQSQAQQVSAATNPEQAQLEQQQAQGDPQGQDNPQQVQGAQDQSARQSPEELGEYAMQQLHTPEELNAFMEVLKQQMPDDLDYVSKVQQYIDENKSGKLPNTSQITEKTKPSTTGGVDIRPQPNVKPPRRETG